MREGIFVYDGVFSGGVEAEGIERVLQVNPECIGEGDE